MRIKYKQNIFEVYDLDWAFRFGNKNYNYYLTYIADFANHNIFHYGLLIRYDLLYHIHKTRGPKDHKILRTYFICG